MFPLLLLEAKETDHKEEGGESKVAVKHYVTADVESLTVIGYVAVLRINGIQVKIKLS